MQLDKIDSFFGYSSFLYVFPLVIGHRFCSITYINDVYTADCAYRGQVYVPQDLDSAIEILVLSHNNIANINENSFSNYGNLIELYLNDNILLNNSLHKDAFSSLSNLKILDISFLRHHTAFEVNWPPTIEKLSIDKNRNQYKIDLSKISQLKTLNAIDCTLLHFPFFNESASIEEINLSKNSLNHLSVIDLAPLCQLRNLHVQWNSASTLNSTERWCDCFRIETWLQNRGIEATELNCSKPEKSQRSSCDVSFRKEMQIFEQCLKKSLKKGRILGYVFLVLIFIVSIVAFIWYSRRRI